MISGKHTDYFFLCTFGLYVMIGEGLDVESALVL
jgi:hypothetical protein